LELHTLRVGDRRVVVATVAVSTRSDVLEEMLREVNAVAL